MEDELQEVRDNFYVGNFQKALQLCESATPSSDISQFECDATLARCVLSLGLTDKLKSMMSAESPGQRAAALYHVITKSPKEDQREKAKDKLKEHIAEKQDMSSSIIGANVLVMDGSYQDALNLTTAHPTLEMQALRVFIYLLCNQVSMAEKQLQDMAGSNDDSAAYLMASAAVNLANGNPEEAYLTYCDLSAKFPSADGEDSGSILLQTGKGLANMMRGMWQEALEDLQRAHQMAPTDADVLVNLCACMTHTGQKEDFQVYYDKLEQACPNHAFVKKTQSIKDTFARFKASK
jgi:thioredoxin-like negative regulator of GroEL